MIIVSRGTITSNITSIYNETGGILEVDGTEKIEISYLQYSTITNHGTLREKGGTISSYNF